MRAAVRRRLQRVPTSIRRLIVAVIGGTVVGIGVIMIVLPGPAVLVIPSGLAILGTEFVWARRLLGRVRRATPSWLRKRRVSVRAADIEQRAA